MESENSQRKYEQRHPETHIRPEQEIPTRSIFRLGLGLPSPNVRTQPTDRTKIDFAYLL